MSASQRDFAVLGGSFDPVHQGHISIAETISDYLGTTVRLVPVGVPAHKSRLVASPKQRLKMLELATLNQPSLVVDDRELVRESVSYTFETLCSFRDQLGESENLYFVLGMDAYLDLPSWHQWQSLLNVAHIIVCRRASVKTLPPALRLFEQAYRVRSMDELKAAPCGFVYYVENAAVEVSSSEVRARLWRDDSVTGMINPEVARFISEQKLYRSTGDEGMSQ